MKHNRKSAKKGKPPAARRQQTQTQTQTPARNSIAPAVPQRSKLAEIDLVRGFAILAVIIVHATSYATVQMVNSGLYGVYNFFNIFSKVGTTSFILLSSFVLFYNYYPQPFTLARIRKFYRNRLLYIIVPYVLFSVLYFALTRYVSGSGWAFPGMIDSFLYKLARGQAYIHLYFVFISIQLYILFPLFLAVMQRWKWLAAAAIPIGLILQWGFFIANREWSLVGSRGSWAPTYFGHYLLGAWLGIYYDRIKEWLIIAKEKITRTRLALWIVLWLVWLGSGIANVWIYYEARLHNTRFPVMLYDAMWDVYTMITPLVFMQLAYLLYSSRAYWLTARLRDLGAASFGIYLVHPLFLHAYRQFPPAASHPQAFPFWYAGGFVFALAASWLLVSMISRSIPFAWLAFGSVPAQLKALRRQEAAAGTRPVPERQRSPSAPV